MGTLDDWELPIDFPRRVTRLKFRSGWSISGMLFGSVGALVGLSAIVGAAKNLRGGIVDVFLNIKPLLFGLLVLLGAFLSV